MQQCNLFKFLDPQFVEYCVRYSIEEVLPIGSIIFKEGDSSSEVYYIKQGDIEQSIKPLKQSNDELKVKKIEVDIAAPNEEFDQIQDDFDPEKFLKSTLFNQTLYEKGGPVAKNRQFWNQGDSQEDLEFVTHLKNELDSNSKKFLKMGIRHTKIAVEDELKKYMISSLSNKFNKPNNSFLKKATNENKSSGLKLSILSKGSYFGDEILSNHPLLNREKDSTSSLKRNSISFQINEESQSKGNQSHKHRKSYFKQKTNESNILQKSKYSTTNKSEVIDIIKMNQNDNDINTEEDNEKANKQIDKRQYTVKCRSAECCVLRITMEMYLSFTFLNQKEQSAQKYLQSKLKEQRRQSRLEDHAQLIQLSNNALTPQQVIKQRHKSILSDKIMEFIHSNNQSSLDSLDTSSIHQKNQEQSTPKNKNSTPKNKDSTPNINDQSTPKNKDQSTPKNRFQSENTYESNSNLSNTESQKDRNNFTNQLNKLNLREKKFQLKIIKQRHSIAHTEIGQSSQKQQDSQSSISQLNETNKLTPNGNKKNSVFFNTNTMNTMDKLSSPEKKMINHTFDGNSLPHLHKNNKNRLSIDVKNRKGIINYINQDSNNDIHSPLPIIPQMSPKQSKIKEEIDQLYQTFSTIIQKEENRQKQISLMTNTFQKLNKPSTPNQQDSFKQSPIASPNLTGRQLSENAQNSQRPIQSPHTPTSDGLKNSPTKGYFFRPSYQELKSLLINPSQKSFTTFLNNTNNNPENNNNLKINLNKQSYASLNFEGNEEFQLNSNKQMYNIPSLTDIKKSSQQLSQQEDSQSNINSNNNNNIFNTAHSSRNTLSKNNIQQMYQLGANLNIEIDHTQNLIKEKVPQTQQNSLSFMKKKPQNPSIMQFPGQQSQSTNSIEKRQGFESDKPNQEKLSYQSFEKNSPLSSPNGEVNIMTKSKFTYDSKNVTDDDYQTNKLKQKTQSLSEKMLVHIPQSQVLKPLFNEIIQKEKSKLEKTQNNEKPKRVMIEINRDFYIKKYRKAYMEAYHKQEKSQKSSVVSLFDNINTSQNKKEKLSEEELSLLFQKKLQIDKKFPNSQRAHKINEFFNKQVQKLDEQHRNEMMKCKRAKDLSIVTTNELLNKLEEQNRKQEMDLEFAGTYFNFVSKEINSSPKYKPYQDNFSINYDKLHLK